MFPSSTFKPRQNNKAQGGNNNRAEKARQVPTKRRGRPPGSTSKKPKLNLGLEQVYVNYINTRTSNNNKKIEFANLIKTLKNIINNKNFKKEVNQVNFNSNRFKRELQNLVNNTLHRDNATIALSNIKRFLTNDKIKMSEKIINILKYIKVNSLTSFKNSINLQNFLYYILNEIGKTLNNRKSSKIVSHVMGNNYNKILKKAHVPAMMYEHNIKQNKLKNVRELNFSDKPCDFFNRMGEDIIHDIGSVSEDKFLKIFSGIMTILDLNIDKNNLNEIKNHFRKFDNKRAKKSNSIKYVKGQIEENIEKRLKNKISASIPITVKTSRSQISNYNYATSKDFIAYKFKNNKKKYYKQFDIVVDSDDQELTIGSFIKHLFIDRRKKVTNQRNSNHVARQLICVPQILDKGVFKAAFNPRSLLEEHIVKGKVNHFIFNENRVTIKVNLGENIGYFYVEHRFNPNTSMYETLINGKPILIKRQKNAKGATSSNSLSIQNTAENVLGKFLGDFMMIIKVLEENSKKPTAFGTIDRSAALSFLTLAPKFIINERITKDPRLFFVQKNSDNLGRVLYMTGMKDIISNRCVRDPKISHNEFNRERAPENQTRKINNARKTNNYLSGSNNSVVNKSNNLIKRIVNQRNMNSHRSNNNNNMNYRNNNSNSNRNNNRR